MISVVGLVQQFAIDRILSAGTPVSHNSKVVLGLAALAGFALLLGLVFVMYAMNLWLNTLYVPHISALITGGICIILSLISVLVLFIIFQFRKPPMEKFQDETIEMVKSVAEFVDVGMRDVMEKNPVTLLAVASIAGLLIGKKYL